MNSHDKFTSKTKLAGVYMDDGDRNGAARILRELADDLELDAKRSDEEFTAAIGISTMGMK